jgi:TPR repeat protein
MNQPRTLSSRQQVDEPSPAVAQMRRPLRGLLTILLGLSVMQPVERALAATTFLLEETEGVGSSKFQTALKIYGSGRKREAASLLAKLAQAGDHDAQFALAQIYESGEGLERSVESALKWYRKAAGTGRAHAQFRVARLLLVTPGGEKEGLTHLRAAADGGQGEAMVMIGGLLRTGTGLERDPAAAREWFNKAGAANIPAGYFFLGQMHELGEGGDRSHTEALAAYNKAADGGLLKAIIHLAAAYQLGSLGETDFAKAKKLWARGAIERKNSRCQFGMGLLYELGHGEEKDMEKALFWYRKAAEADDGQALSKLGELYEKGSGVDKDLTTAIGHYKKAAATGLGEPMWQLSRINAMGIGVEKDPTAALKWLIRAASSGMALAEYSLALHYRDGKGVMVDQAAAVAWLRRAASRGLAAAQVDLAGIIVTGANGTPNQEAVDLYSRAAGRGEPRAHVALGEFYETGNGGQADPVKAYAHYLAAAKAGHEPGVKKRDALKPKLSPQQIASAEALLSGGGGQ